MITPDTLELSLVEYNRLKDRKDELNDELKEVNDALKNINFELVEYFDNHDIENMRVKGIGLFYKNTQVLPRIEDAEVVKEWLAARNDLDILQSINSQKFAAYYRERLDNNLELPPSVTQFVKSEVRLRRS